MEFLSAEWYATLLAIIAIDLLVAGDNAVVIAMAARKLDPMWRKRAIIWGTVGAIVVRTICVFFIIKLLELKGLSLVAGLVLYVIAWMLLKPEETDNSKKVSASDSFISAFKTILVADVVMGLDNMLAIAAAAKGDIVLVIVGLLVSIPVMMGGSVIILKLLDKYPWLTIAGSALLSGIAGRVIVDDKLFDEYWEAWGFTPLYQWIAILLMTAIVTSAALLWYRHQASKAKPAAEESKENKPA